MNSIFTIDFASPLGTLILGDFKGKLCLCDWKHRKQRARIDSRLLSGLNSAFTSESTALLRETSKQLHAYFSGNLNQFELPLQLVGTEFQHTVWNELLQLSYGKTDTYLSLSQKIGNPKAIRAVASANGANAISIIVPCHRIIGSNGELIGYAGGMEAKKKLLAMENPNFRQQLRLF